MATTIDTINSKINTVLNPLLGNGSEGIAGNPWVKAVFALIVIFYGTLIAPKVSPKYAVYFTNTWFRLIVLMVIVLLFNKDPTLSILIAIAYFWTMKHLYDNTVTNAKTNGINSNGVAVIASAGKSTDAKSPSDSHMVAPMASQFGAQSTNSGPTGMTGPQAVLASMEGAGTQMAMSSIPSDTAANSPAVHTHGKGDNGIPEAYTPDGLQDVAAFKVT